MALGRAILAPSLAAIPELSQSAYHYVLEGWAKTNPEAAAGWIAQRLASGAKMANMGDSTLAEIAVSRPEFAAGWIPTLPEGEVQTNAARALAANWAAFDPRAAEAWIASLPAGPLRESAETARAQALSPAGK